MSDGMPPMEGGWDELFDASYFRLYAHTFDEDRARGEAEAAGMLAGLPQGGEVLDCPCGFARHSIPLSEAGFRVTGVDRSEVQLAEAERRRGQAEWPRLVRADYRELPFADASFDAVVCLFSSLGYLPREGDVRVLSEFRRVLRTGGTLILETMHRDRLARIFGRRDWEEDGEGGLIVREREFDVAAGTVWNRQLHLPEQGERISRSFVVRVYTATEWAAMAREAGFTDVECLGGLGGGPPTIEERLVVRAR